MKADLLGKIETLFTKGSKVSEDEVRSLMILLRKILEDLSEMEKQEYLTLNLYCNWCAHTKIDQSNTGLRIIAKVNDALVIVKDIQDATETQSKVTQSISYVDLRRELISFLKHIGLNPSYIERNDIWGNLITHLLEIIRDVPLQFPSLSSLDATKQKIYDQIALNPISPGHGVVAMQIIKFDYAKLGRRDMGTLLSVQVTLESGLSIVVPLLLNVTLV